MTAEQQKEVYRLASLMATARVRRYAMKHNPSTTNGETCSSVAVRCLKAELALKDYLKSLEQDVPNTQKVVRLLIEVAGAAFDTLDNSEERSTVHDGDTELLIQHDDYETLSAALGGLDDLPDDQPGYTLGPAGKAEWALRDLLGQKA